MLQNVFDTRGRIGWGPYPKSIADTSLKPPPFDRAHAAALLDSAGWTAGADGMRSRNGRPLAFKIAVPSSSAQRTRYSVMMQEQLKAVGIRADIDQMDFGAHQTGVETGRYDATLIGWNSDPSPTDLRQTWTQDGFPPAGQNFTRYSNPAIDAIADSMVKSGDPARLSRLRHRAYEIILADAPAVWLYDILTIGGAHERLQPGFMRADAWWTDLAEWSIPASARIERDRVGLSARSPAP
jgi:peptide/nickel transport system substrate-binding protein